MLLVLSVELAGSVKHIVKVTSRQDAVVMFLVVFIYIEVNRAFAFVSESVVEDFLYQLNLLYDMTRCVRLDAGRKHVERSHGVVVADGVVLHHFHRFQLLQTGFLSDFVFAFVSVVFQVAYIGNVTNVAHFISQLLEVAEQDIEGDGRTSVSQVCVAIYSRTAYVHAHMRGIERNKLLFSATKSIINGQFIFHNRLILSVYTKRKSIEKSEY